MSRNAPHTRTREDGTYHTAKLTSQDVVRIRKVYSPVAYSTVQLAKEYEVSQSTISSIITRKTWRHLP